MALSPGLLSRSALGHSTTWSPKVPTDTYSFSSGPWLGSGSSELLGLMARSAEQPEKGWLSSREASTPGLLTSGSECKLPELPSGRAHCLLWHLWVLEPPGSPQPWCCS